MWSPPDPGKGVEWGSADVVGRRGSRFGKWMGACWFLESTQNNGGAVSPGILVLESLAAGSLDRLPTPLERDLAEA